MTTRKTAARKPPAKPKATATGRTPAKKPATANKPKTAKAPTAKPATAKRRTETRRAVDAAAQQKTTTTPRKVKPLPLPDAPDTDAATDARDDLLELDAANMVGDTDFDPLPTRSDKFAFLDAATPLITKPTFGLKGVLLTAVLALAVGALFGGSWAYGSALDKGWSQGQRAAYLTTSIAAMQNYLQCTAEPPACAGQQATATWTKEFTDGKLAELEGEED